MPRSEFILAVKQTCRAEERNEEGGGGMGFDNPLQQSRSQYTELTGNTPDMRHTSRPLPLVEPATSL